MHRSNGSTRLALALIAVATLVLAGGCGEASSGASSAATKRALAVLDGAPQSGPVLGRPTAPAQLTLYADLTSPNLPVFQQQVLPVLVKRYVRPGRLSIRLSPVVATTGSAADDALLAARTAEVLGRHGHGWQFASVFAAQYLQYLDAPSLRAIVGSVPGVAPAAAVARAGRPDVAAAVDASNHAERRVGAHGPLALVLTTRDNPPVIIDAEGVLPGALLRRIERSLAGVLVARRRSPPPRLAPPAHKPRRASAPRPPKPNAALGPIALVTGLAQRGFSLGAPSAPAKLAVYADITDPRYAAFQRAVLPGLIARYVRPGRVLLQLRTFARPGAPPVADRAARAVQAAGLQDHLWQYAGVLVAGARGSIAAAEVSRALHAVPGLDARRAAADAATPRIARAVARSARRAGQYGVSGSFGLVLQVGSRAPQLVVVPVLAGRAVDAQLDRLLGR